MQQIQSKKSYILNFYQKNKSSNVETNVSLEEEYIRKKQDLEKVIEETNEQKKEIRLLEHKIGEQQEYIEGLD